MSGLIAVNGHHNVDCKTKFVVLDTILLTINMKSLCQAYFNLFHFTYLTKTCGALSRRHIVTQRPPDITEKKPTIPCERELAMAMANDPLSSECTRTASRHLQVNN